MAQKNSFPYAFDYGADWEHYGQSVHTSSLCLYTNCSHIQLRQLGLWITGYLPTICQPINPLLYVHRPPWVSRNSCTRWVPGSCRHTHKCPLLIGQYLPGCRTGPPTCAGRVPLDKCYDYV